MVICPGCQKTREEAKAAVAEMSEDAKKPDEQVTVKQDTLWPGANLFPFSFLVSGNAARMGYVGVNVVG
ncbi:hypothetical protein R84B8_01100 [Treponema sp. R8-4-B8]